MNDKGIDPPYRKQMRLKGYDYSKAGYYFVTICTHDRSETLGRIVGGDALTAPSVLLSEIGTIIEKYMNNINTKHEGAHVDKYVIMPNHIHMIIALDNGAMWASPPTDGRAAASFPSNGTGGVSSPKDKMTAVLPLTDARMPKIIRSLKTLVAKESGVSVFQRSYYDHIIRHEEDYLAIWNYIDANPLRWADDEYFKAITPV